MNAARLQELEKGLSGIAKKVLEAVPISEQWNRHKIYGELGRIGHNIEKASVDGCLKYLMEMGLVREPARGSFIRIVAKPRAQTHDIELSAPRVPPQATNPLAVPADPLDQMAAVATALRAQAKHLNEQADLIDEIAINSQDQLTRASADSAKLKQLQQLLKGSE